MNHDKNDLATKASVLGLICAVLFDKYAMTPAEVTKLFCLKHTKGAEIILSRVGRTRYHSQSKTEGQRRV